MRFYKRKRNKKGMPLPGTGPARNAFPLYIKEKRKRKASARSRACQEHLHAIYEDEAWKEASARRRADILTLSTKRNFLGKRAWLVGALARDILKHLKAIYDMKPRSCMA